MRQERYDFIVVGSGSAGGVIAARLSENGRYSVLCVEAGTRTERYIWARSPLGGAYMTGDSRVAWTETARPDPDLGHRALSLARGKILGGTSAVNGTIVNRGQPEDYDAWKRAGCHGWGYTDVLPYFKRIERTSLGSDADRGRDGPVAVTEADRLGPLFDLMTDAAVEAGLERNPDYLGRRQEGVAMAQLAGWRGRRHSTATQYLAPARKRRNLVILQGAEVTALLLSGHRCTGIRYCRNGTMAVAHAGQEVIVCCGAINSPKLLELSGIGNPDILGPCGIAVAHALPGVGENLRDHFGPHLKWRLNGRGLSLTEKGSGWRFWCELLRYMACGKGLMAHGLPTLRIFMRSHADAARPDLQMMMNPYLVEMRNGKRAMSTIDGFYVAPQVQRPESAGSVHIESADPFAVPAVRYSFLATPADRALAIASVRHARRIVSMPPIRDVIDHEIAPGDQVQSDADILRFIRECGVTNYHPVGTCRMGQDDMAVVDERLRVRGMAGLRVADASVMPMIVSGNTSMPCMMIGEKCADMVLDDAR